MKMFRIITLLTGSALGFAVSATHADEFECSKSIVCVAQYGHGRSAAQEIYEGFSGSSDYSTENALEVAAAECRLHVDAIHPHESYPDRPTPSPWTSFIVVQINKLDRRGKLHTSYATPTPENACNKVGVNPNATPVSISVINGG